MWGSKVQSCWFDASTVSIQGFVLGFVLDLSGQSRIFKDTKNLTAGLFATQLMLCLGFSGAGHPNVVPKKTMCPVQGCQYQVSS